jgi:hypothetical protein
VSISTRNLWSDDEQLRKVGAEELADSWQLLAKHDVEYASAADLGFHQHHARMFRDDVADNRSIRSQRVLLHTPEYAIGAVF